MTTEVTVTVNANERNEVNVQPESAISPVVLQPGQSADFDLDNGAINVTKGQEISSVGGSSQPPSIPRVPPDEA